MNKLKEQDINEYLRLGLKVYKELVAQDKTKLANLVLAITSRVADMDLTLSGIQKDYYKAYCPTCGKQLTNGVEIEITKQIGECPGCDHIRADIKEQA